MGGLELATSSIPEFITELQAALDAATSNLAIAQQSAADLQATVDQLTSDIATLQGYVATQMASGAPSTGILTPLPTDS